MAIVGAGCILLSFFFLGLDRIRVQNGEQEMGWDDEMTSHILIPQLWLAAARLNELQWGLVTFG
jgi:hypothetical protein